MAATKSKLPLATEATDNIAKIRKKKRIKLMNFQHRVLNQKMVKLDESQQKKYSGLLNE